MLKNRSYHFTRVLWTELMYYIVRLMNTLAHTESNTLHVMHLVIQCASCMKIEQLAFNQ